MTGVHGRLIALAEQLTGLGERPAPPCPDPVNLPMIRHWTQAIGDTNPVYVDEPAARDSVHAGLVAPPAMIQVWSMQGPTDGGARLGSVADAPLRMLDEAGYTGVVATNCEQTYDRYVHPGEDLCSTMRMGSIAGPKKTALGEGYFVTWYQTWYAAEKRVAEMMFRILKFRPRPAGELPDQPATLQKPAAPLRPAIDRDTQFFWDGAKAGELRIQHCANCGQLRHPPGPMCPRCHVARRQPGAPAGDYVVASGRGEVYSYVVHHHPPVPGREPPFVVVLVALPEGVRMVGNLLGCAPENVRVGMPVQVVFEHVDDELTLPQWEPLDPREGLPELRLSLTPTFVVATALATRDFTPVHHDPAVARAQGSADIFLNILTTMGLVQRFVTDWAGPDALVRGISLKLGAPAYAGDTLTLTGRVASRTEDEVVVEVRGAVSLGDHATATVRLTLPGGAR